MPSGKPADPVGVWFGGLRWVEAAWMQTHRFEEALYEHTAALFDAQQRAWCNKPEGAQWRNAYDQEERSSSQRPVRVPTVALTWQIATEMDLLIVAVRNVLRAQDILPDQLQSAMTGQDILELLRNIGEHWDEVEGSSQRGLAREYPDIVVGEVQYTNKEIWIGGVPISRIVAWLVRVREALISALKESDITVLDEMDSIVEGDDALAWPQRRLRHRLWQAQTFDIDEDWDLAHPPEVVENVERLMAERFKNLRARDFAD
jgi:hypothetical protein